MNKLTLTAVLGLSMAGICSAGTVYLTGSTAMRGVVYNTIVAPGVVFQAAPTTTLYQGGTTGSNAGSGANYMAFSGTLVGGSGTTIIQCHWSGSEGGILDVASNTVVTESFMSPASMDGTDHGTNLPPSTVTANVNLAMADNAQSFSRTKLPKLTAGKEVGVITFKWVRNPGAWTGSNVTDSQIRQALGGLCPLAVFSGNAADTANYVYVSGRDNQSGTRVNAFGDSGFGIFTTPVQIEMNSSGVMQSVGGSYGGDFGFSSGGTLAGTMGANTVGKDDPYNGLTGSGYSVIAYLSVGDAATAITAGATELAYDGITFSSAAVKEGTYTFWGNEYIYQANNVTTGSEANNVYSLLSATTGINTYCDGVKAIKLTDMHCTRSGPTSDPSHN
ncbi:MAG TPA: hypothetical protein VMJ12_13020 [Candidatus Acidoferrales bacterium]|nr:hypothetical protein [Candidatus Acidoferrales bacterium]